MDLGNVITYTLAGGTISTEYSITAYDSSKDGTDDVIDGNASRFSVAAAADSNTIKVSLSSASSISEPTTSAIVTATLDRVAASDVTVNFG